MAEKWIQEIDIKKGALHKQLGIPEDQKITMSLLDKILLSRPGDTISFKLPGMKKTKKIKVTPLLLKRARLAKTLKQLRKGK